jgi:hypothetical protein
MYLIPQSDFRSREDFHLQSRACDEQRDAKEVLHLGQEAHDICAVEEAGYSTLTKVALI